jgi:nucleoside-diphosphate-sugar epimerase
MMKCIILPLFVTLTTAFSPSHHHHLLHQPSETKLSSTAGNPSGDPRGLAESTYPKVFVAGGSRGVGRAIIDQLLQDETVTQIVALVRTPEAAADLQALDASSDRIRAIVGDAFDYKTVEGAIDGCDAAVTTLGGSVSDDDDQRIDYIGNNNVIEACGILGCVRIVLVTSIGCGSSKEATPPNVYETLAPVLKAKDKAENVLQKYYTNMLWTIVRPGGLKSEPKTGKAILTEDTKAIGSIHREDVAELVVKALGSEGTVRKVLSAVDVSLGGIGGGGEGVEFEPFVLE